MSYKQNLQDRRTGFLPAQKELTKERIKTPQLTMQTQTMNLQEELLVSMMKALPMGCSP
jgi:hypothetical protein